MPIVKNHCPCSDRDTVERKHWGWGGVGVSTANRQQQGVTKRCRLSWLTNSALLYEPKFGRGRGGGCAVSDSKTAVHRSPNKLLISNSMWATGNTVHVDKNLEQIMLANFLNKRQSSIRSWHWIVLGYLLFFWSSCPPSFVLSRPLLVLIFDLICPRDPCLMMPTL